MVTIDNVFEKLRDISESTLSNPTHIMLSYTLANSLLDQYNKMVEEDSFEIYGVEDKKYVIADLGDLFGLTLIIYGKEGSGFKILEELISHP